LAGWRQVSESFAVWRPGTGDAAREKTGGQVVRDFEEWIRMGHLSRAGQVSRQMALCWILKGAGTNGGFGRRKKQNHLGCGMAISPKAMWEKFF
jgi:hypothetical protein